MCSQTVGQVDLNKEFFTTFEIENVNLNVEMFFACPNLSTFWEYMSMHDTDTLNDDRLNNETTHTRVLIEFEKRF